jgi:hypothetical protein
LLCLGTLSSLAQLTYEQLRVDYDSALSFQHLQLIPIRFKGPVTKAEKLMGLKEALSGGWVEISERGNASTEDVHVVKLKVKSKLPLYIGAGELISGGRQDRMITHDTLLLPTGDEQFIDVMCVEQDRWSEKEKKFNHLGYANPRLRMVAEQSRNQAKVWAEVYRQIDSSGLEAPTLSYSVKRTDKKIQAELQPYRDFFRKALECRDSSWTGVVAISGWKILGAEIFESPTLFFKQAQGLLEGFYEEALFEGSLPKVTNELVVQYLQPVLQDEVSQEKYLKQHGTLLKVKNRTIHLSVFGEKQQH